jgi:holo-[acyl-carrier protein] synthase
VLRWIGFDLVCVDEVSEAIRRHGERYLTRVYTPGELADSGADARRLAARFAAKEATIKVLRPDREAIPWHFIATVVGERGQPALVLSGAAAAVARDRRIDALALSLVDRGPIAAAIVIGEVRE